METQNSKVENEADYKEDEIKLKSFEVRNYKVLFGNSSYEVLSKP